MPPRSYHRSDPPASILRRRSSKGSRRSGTTKRRANGSSEPRRSSSSSETPNDASSGASSSIRTTSILTLAEAEAVLLNPLHQYDDVHLKRIPYPEDCTRLSDIYVQPTKLCLERSGGDPRRDPLAASTRQIVERRFQHALEKFASDGARDKDSFKTTTTLTIPEDPNQPYYDKHRPEFCELILHTYLVDASPGSRSARIVAAESGVGRVRVCMAWILSSLDSSVVYDGGRLGLLDSMALGVLDMLYISTGEQVLASKLAPQCVREIVRCIQRGINVSTMGSPEGGAVAAVASRRTPTVPNDTYDDEETRDEGDPGLPELITVVTRDDYDVAPPKGWCACGLSG